MNMHISTEENLTECAIWNVLKFDSSSDHSSISFAICNYVETEEYSILMYFKFMEVLLYYVYSDINLPRISL